nr:MAG TPA: hypothetical protein [Caudoviricetes sp.]
MLFAPCGFREKVRNLGTMTRGYVQERGGLR